MSQMLSGEKGKREVPSAGARGLVVNRIRYRNSAAKFWCSLFDEVADRFAECDGVSLHAMSAGLLTPTLLTPTTLLQSGLDALETADLRQVFHDTLMELEIAGPPAPVRAELLSGPAVVKEQDLPLECADAELMSFLLVWLLEWGRVSDFVWNDACVRGSMTAFEWDFRYAYRIAFQIDSRHLSEGLYERRVTVRFRRDVEDAKR